MQIRSLQVKYTTDPSAGRWDNRIPLRDPRTAASVLIPMLQDEAQEVFVVLLLDARGRLIAKHEISRGSLTETTVSPRLIFRAAILSDATQIILAHNHPSGDPTPSQPDIALTRQVITGAALLGELTIADHIIIGAGRYFSMKESGIL